MTSARVEANGMLPRPVEHVGASKFYTYKELAELWRVKHQTVRVWFMELRRAGRGPAEGQVCIVQRRANLRLLLVRADYALFVQRVKIEGMK